MSSEDMGCPYRQWGWHDGGPDHGCIRDGRVGICCEDSWSDWFQCDWIKLRGDRNVENLWKDTSEKSAQHQEIKEGDDL